MAPTRNPEVTLPDLIEVLLNKGTYLNLDLIIAVADIPLIGINLRATIAGMETMLEYGMMRDWDERTRAWVQQSMSRNVPLRAGEELIAKLPGGHYQDDFYRVWRPGALYVTNQRMVVFRRDPQEVLWEAELADITGVDVVAEQTVGGEERKRLVIETSDAETATLSASDPDRVREMILRRSDHAVTGGGRSKPETRKTLVQEGSLWYLEERSDGPLWRGGHGRVDLHEGFVWKGPLDARPAVRLRPNEISEVHMASGRTPTGHSTILSLDSTQGTVQVTGQDIDSWARAFTELATREPEILAAEESHGT